MIKVFSKLFVGISGRLNSAGIPLGFMTPYEDNYAGRKRQESVHNWLGGPVEKRVTKIIDNTPREGFTITDDVRDRLKAVPYFESVSHLTKDNYHEIY